MKVEAYGQMMPLNQVATVARAGTAPADGPGLGPGHGQRRVAKAIRDCGLGLNPQPDGQMVRVPLPMLTEERRTELAKIAEQIRRERAHCRAQRAARRHGADQGLEKKHEISEDDERNWSDEVQKLTDRYIKRLDESLAEKEKDIRQV